jgi:hypothetical protein
MNAWVHECMDAFEYDDVNVCFEWKSLTSEFIMARQPSCSIMCNHNFLLK